MTTPERLRRRQIRESWMIAILAALMVISTLVVWADEADDEARDEATIARNSRIGACLTTYADELTDALQDRDVINRTARAAQEETWVAIHDWLNTQPAGSDRGSMLRAIKRYVTILRRLGRAEAINPYPHVADCLSKSDYQAAFVLASYTLGARVCFGMPPTITGTRGNDVIHGTDGPDVIMSFRGDDVIHAGRGKDRICSGNAGDTINGGGGYDRADGWRGVDFCIQVEVERRC